MVSALVKLDSVTEKLLSVVREGLSEEVTPRIRTEWRGFGLERSQQIPDRENWKWAQVIKSGLADFPGGAVVKNPSANAGDTDSSPGPGRSHMPRSN